MRIGTVLALGIAACTVSACGGEATNTGNATAPTSTATPTPAASPTVPFTAVTSIKNDDYEFEYTIPAEVAQFPALAAWLAAERDQKLNDLKKSETGSAKAAKAEGSSSGPAWTTTTWTLAATTPRFVSLSAEDGEFYRGAMHGNSAFRGVLWDREKNARLAATDVFASPAAIQRVFGPAFCTRIKAQQAESREGSDPDATADEYKTCPTVDRATIVLASRHGTAIDTVKFLVPPYVAGPYSEGVFEVALPVTAAVVQAVKSDYRTAFAPKG